MQIDWNAFTPVPALLGGMLIGVAAAMYMLLIGRVAGISGIVGGLLQRDRKDRSTGAAFVLGLVAAPLLYGLVSAWPEVKVEASTGLLLVGGLLVGLGTRYGAGCTSGHCVCGLSMLSLRSLIATLLFMAAGALTVFVVRHLWVG